MAVDDDELGPSRKRVRIEYTDEDVFSIDRATTPSTLRVPISPPRRSRVSPAPSVTHSKVSEAPTETSISKATIESKLIASPFQLTTIEGLPGNSNFDTVSLRDILGDPLIAECWEFNYLHDLDFLMGNFDPDIKALVKVHVVHGFWKREDAADLQMQASMYPNVTLHTAYMPEMFGTHHTKMMVLLRHDDTAQIIIHTANMIRRDWKNMTQAIWQSPLLPLTNQRDLPTSLKPGSGGRFKLDFLAYLKAYDSKKTVCKSLIAQLDKYDFSSIRGSLISSVPGRHAIDTSKSKPLWGWLALRNALSAVPVKGRPYSEIVAQVSSIATLGITDQWLDKTLFNSLRISSLSENDKTKCKIIFPTPDEIRRSLDGYSSGASIRLKLESGPQIKQLQYLKPLLHHWAGDGSQHTDPPVPNLHDAGRKRAAPHIKTYIRFANAAKSELDWALLTSANLSKQAWGEAVNKAGDVRISSYELGVLVWPALYADDAVMVPTFKQDLPTPSDAEHASKTLLGLRMPYDLPLTKYTASDKPWSATGSYNEPDWMGQTWNNG